MKQSFRITGIDCANCASKLERKLQKIDGVTNATLNFFTSKLVIEGADDRFEGILAEMERIIRKQEPDAVVKKA